MRWAKFNPFYSAGLPRAFFEALLVSGILLWLIARGSLEIPSQLVSQGFVIVAISGGSIAGLRFRRITQGGWIILLQETLIGLVYGFLTGLLAILIGLAAGTPNYIADSSVGLMLGIFVLTGSSLVYLGWRVVSELWMRWTRLTRRRFLWGLTQVHLWVVIILTALFLIFVTIGAEKNPPTWMEGREISALARFASELLTGMFPLVLVWVFLAGVAAVGVLPFSVVISWIVSRPLVKRVESLAKAARMLRSGDLSARVQPSGEDEIAQLQDDFNTMAAALEQAQRDLQAERDKVSALLTAQRELTAAVSHELRTPVATLRGYLENDLEERQGALPEAYRHDLEIMTHEILRLQNLIDDLFALSRAEVKRLDLSCRAVDAVEIIRRTVETVKPGAWGSGRVEVLADVPAVLPQVFADPLRLEQVLRNLVNNAVRHTPPGGIVVIQANVEEELVCLCVTDTGEGIPADQIEHIWERFYKGEGSTGSGLGLALVKELVETMGGTVGVESRIGEGSRFRVWLPKAA